MARAIVDHMDMKKYRIGSLDPDSFNTIIGGSLDSNSFNTIQRSQCVIIEFCNKTIHLKNGSVTRKKEKEHRFSPRKYGAFSFGDEHSY